MSSRRPASKPTRSSSLVAAPSRRFMAAEKDGACPSKSRRTGISVVRGAVMGRTLDQLGARLCSSSMSRSWAIGDVDLHLDVDGTRVRGALERTLRDALRSGRLAPGTRLPSSRSLARDLRIARNTVAAAYAQLVAEGWLEGRQGAGTRVALHRAGGPPAPSAPPPPRAPRFDLRPGVPDL